MNDVFRAILNMSVTGGIAALAVILLRIPLKRAPRWISCALWAVVFLRLAVPVSFSAPVSLLGGIGAPEPVNGTVTYLAADQSAFAVPSGKTAQDISGIFSAPSSAVESASSLASTPQVSADPMQIWLAVGMTVWMIGVAGILLYAIMQYTRLKRRVSDAVRSELDIYETDAVTSPFVMGVFRPRIILPVGMRSDERKLVLLHERAHVYRLDHVAKPVAFLILALHWFNPLVWLAFRLFCDDMEASCDERAMKACNREEIAAYGETLLRLGTQRAAFAGGPLAFGEHCTKERIINVLNYKKPAFWIVAVAVLAAIAAGIFLLANPIVRPKQAVEPTAKELDLVNMQASAFDQQTYDQSVDGGWWVGCNPSQLIMLSMDLSVLGDKIVSAQSIVDVANQLANGQTYIKAYLKKNAAGCYDKDVANSKYDYVIADDDYYSYAIHAYPHRIRVGRMYWHCVEQYILSILHPESQHWQHYGYAEYLSRALNPYDLWLSKVNEKGTSPEFGVYVQTYLDNGGSATNLTNDDYRILIDSIAYYCLKNGMNWGTAYESYPITKIYGFTEPAEQGDDMSVAMASSFCAYLAEHYGFDRLTSYCSGQMTFKEAFRTSFDRAYAKWEKSILNKFSK